MSPRQFYVYILASRSRRLYTGVTNDLVRRVWQHRNGCSPRAHAARYNITRLVHYEVTPNVDAAIAREKEIKSWRREKRLRLIEAENAGWLDLAAGWFSDEGARSR